MLKTSLVGIPESVLPRHMVKNLYRVKLKHINWSVQAELERKKKQEWSIPNLKSNIFYNPISIIDEVKESERIKRLVNSSDTNQYALIDTDL